MAFARMFMHSYSRGRAWKWLDNQPSDKHRPAGVERERAADSRNFERQPTRKSGFKSLSISGGVMARLSSSFSRFTKPTHTFICSNLRNAPPFSFKLISKQSLISSSKIRERERRIGHRCVVNAKGRRDRVPKRNGNEERRREIDRENSYLVVDDRLLLLPNPVSGFARSSSSSSTSAYTRLSIFQRRRTPTT